MGWGDGAGVGPGVGAEVGTGVGVEDGGGVGTGVGIKVMVGPGDGFDVVGAGDGKDDGWLVVGRKVGAELIVGMAVGA